MQLTNLTKFHLLFYVAMALALAFGFTVLAAPIFMSARGYSFWWAAPIWGVGQGLMLLWMSKVVDPLSKKMNDAAATARLRKFNAVPLVVMLIAGGALYFSYRQGRADGIAHMSEMVRINCDMDHPLNSAGAEKCHQTYSFDVEAALAKVRKSQN